MLKKLTVMVLALIIALASVCLPSFADSGADISAAVQSGDAPGEGAAQEGAEAGPGASAEAEGEEAVLYDDAETALSIMNELPATITAAQAVQAGHVMRLKAEEPDLNTVVFKNGDGTRTAYQYAVPVKYVENGEIKDKSSRLVATDKGGYAYENEANEVKTYFPQGLGEKGARLEYGGYALELTPVTAETLGVYSAGSSLAAGGSVLRNVTEAADGMNYAGALGEGISLRYTPTLTGLKEDIILDSYTGRSSFSFRLRTEGLELCEISGNWYLSDPESGEIVVELGEIYIHDSYAGNVAEGEQNAHEAYGCITAETIEEGEEYILSVHAPAEYLSAPGTVYPVYIDPTFNVVNTYIQDTHISSGYPSRNYNTASLLNLGYGSSSKSTRILAKVTSLTGGELRPGWPIGTFPDITSATYHMYCTSSYTSNPYVDVYRVKNSWSNTGATWSNASSSTFSGATLVSSTRVGNKGWYEFDITSAYDYWCTVGVYNYGLLFKMRVESASENYWRQFASATYSDSSKLPYVKVIYDEPATMSINPSSLKLYPSEGYKLSVTVNPSGSAYGMVYWSSSNTSVATVNNTTGEVIAVASGTTVITGVMNTGATNLTATCTVTVLSGTPVVYTDTEYYIFNNRSYKPITVKNNTLTAGTAVWQMDWNTSRIAGMKWKAIRLSNGSYALRLSGSSNLALSAYNSMVTIQNIGTSNNASDIPTHAQWIITPYEDGEVTLSARSNTMAYMQTNRDNNGASENIIMGLNKPAYAYYRFIAADRYEPTQSVSIPSEIYIAVGETYTFSPMVNPVNATFADKIYWEWGNSSIAKVNDIFGKTVTGKSKGTAWVRVRCRDTNKNSLCQVHVVCGTPGNALNPASHNLVKQSSGDYKCSNCSYTTSTLNAVETSEYSTLITETPYSQAALDDIAVGTAEWYSESMLTVPPAWWGSAWAAAEAAKIVAGQDVAADCLLHFLDNTGTERTDFPVKRMLTEEGTNSEQYKDMKEELNKVMSAAETLAISGSSVSFVRKFEDEGDEPEGFNWKNSLGGYRIATKCTVNKIGNTYSATVTYIVRDYYDWKNDELNLSLFGIAADMLDSMHRHGWARNYHNSGQATITLSWTQGQRIGSGASHNIVK